MGKVRKRMTLKVSWDRDVNEMKLTFSKPWMRKDCCWTIYSIFKEDWELNEVIGVGIKYKRL